jgi:hypothetical protein
MAKRKKAAPATSKTGSISRPGRVDLTVSVLTVLFIVISK